MPLDPSYLDYPLRRHGYDHALYPWSNLHARPPVRWPGGKAVAVWIVVNLEWFPMEPADKPFRAPGHMQTPYPDYRHYTARDYGTRVGFYRFLEAFARLGVKVSVAVNSAHARRTPQLIADIVTGGHEIIAHSTDMNGAIASGLDEAAERALIQTAKAELEAASGQPVTGWRSIAGSQSFNTLRLLKEAGYAYQCDWVNDELPYLMTNGLANLPLNHELSDRQIIAVQQQSAESYAEQIQDAFAWLAAEAGAGAEAGGRMLPLNITPYILGLPYRIDAFERLLGWLAAQTAAWFARGDELLAAWRLSQKG